MLDPTELTAIMGMDVLEKRKHVHMDVCMRACANNKKLLKFQSIAKSLYRLYHPISPGAM
jgi:hypothetical protein